MKLIIFVAGSTIITVGILPLFSESIFVNAAGILWLAAPYYIYGTGGLTAATRLDYE